MYAAGWRLLKCVLHLYLLLYWWSKRGFKAFLLILGYSSILLFKNWDLQNIWDSKEAFNRQSDFNV